MPYVVCDQPGRQQEALPRCRPEKLRILDEIAPSLGTIGSTPSGFAARDSVERSSPNARLRLYDGAVREALIVISEAFDRLCGMQLKALNPGPGAFPRWPRSSLAAPAVRALVLAASAATIDWS